MVIESPGVDPIVFDLGTGLQFWGATQPSDGSFRGTALVTHIHWDHVQGLPFFAPINREGAELRVYGPPQTDLLLADAFDAFMRPPYFPVGVSDLLGDITFHDVENTTLELDGASVLVRPVPHVGLTNGYRVEMDGFVIAYLSDHQMPIDGSHEVSAPVLELCRDADLVIHDSQYTVEEFPEKSHWGHCTVDFAVHVAKEAGAKTLALFHHDPSHTDTDVDRIAAYACDLAGDDLEVVAAAEGLTISFG